MYVVEIKLKEQQYKQAHSPEKKDISRFRINEYIYCIVHIHAIHAHSQREKRRRLLKLQGNPLRLSR